MEGGCGGPDTMVLPLYPKSHASVLGFREKSGLGAEEDGAAGHGLRSEQKSPHALRK